MKRIFGVLACSVILAGCGGATLASSTPSPSATTFTSRTHHFAVTYDPSLFRAETRTYQGQLMLRLHALRSGGDVTVVAAPQGATYVRDALADWDTGTLRTSGSPFDSSFDTWDIFASGADKAQWATLNGVRGVRVETHKGSERTVAYGLMSGDEVYSVYATAPTKQWAADSAVLNAVTQSFRVTK